MLYGDNTETTVTIDLRDIETEIIDYVSRMRRPEEVFDVKELQDWAKRHGYIEDKD